MSLETFWSSLEKCLVSNLMPNYPWIRKPCPLNNSPTNNGCSHQEFTVCQAQHPCLVRFTVYIPITLRWALPYVSTILWISRKRPTEVKEFISVTQIITGQGRTWTYSNSKLLFSVIMLNCFPKLRDKQEQD